MLRKLLATTAFATVLATGAYAQENNAAPAAGETTTTTVPVQPIPEGQAQTGAQTGATQSGATETTTVQTGTMQPAQMQMNGHLASNLIGESIFTTPAVQAAQDAAEGETVQTDANNQAAQGGGEDAQEGELTQTDQATQDQGAGTGTVTQNNAGGQDGAGGQSGPTGDNIGEVSDLVISQDGRVEAVVVGVGGFLGIGEKNVALNFNELQMSQNGNDRYFMVNTTREALEALPEFDRSQYDPAAAANTAMNNATGTTNGGMAPADGTAATVGAGTAANNAANGTTTDQAAQNNAGASGTGTTNTTDATQTGAIDRSQLQEIAQDQLTAETLVGTTVYGANDENIGEIGDIVLTQDGQVDAVLVDVGGFLGIGEKRVAVGMDKLQFLQDGNGNRYLYTNFTQEQLNAQAGYEEGTYSQNRDQQRLIVQ